VSDPWHFTQISPEFAIRFRPARADRTSAPDLGETMTRSLARALALAASFLLLRPSFGAGIDGAGALEVCGVVTAAVLGGALLAALRPSSIGAEETR
jgi:hypothetical protein